VFPGAPGTPHPQARKGNVKVKITHLSLDAAVRQLATIRSAELQLNLTEYFSLLIRRDAEGAGLTRYLGASEAEVRRGNE